MFTTVLNIVMFGSRTITEVIGVGTDQDPYARPLDVTRAIHATEVGGYVQQVW